MKCYLKQQVKKDEFEKIINEFIDYTDFTDDVKEKAKEEVWFKLRKGQTVTLGDHELCIKK
jgi:hypothetical protein